MIQLGASSEDEKASKKLINMLPDEVFSTVNDQSTDFINIQIPLFL